MSTRPSLESCIKQGRGTGEGKNYKPFINYSEVRGTGTACAFPDWKHGRPVQLLSYGELGWYIKLRWDDSVTEIKEQFRMDMELVRALAKKLGYRPPAPDHQMTTDLVAYYKDGHREAYSVKYAPKEMSPAEKRRYDLEQAYWAAKNAPWKQVYRTDLNEVEIMNIRDVVKYYDPSHIVDEFGIVRHLIATKQLEVDLTQNIDYVRIISALKEDSSWSKYLVEHC